MPTLSEAYESLPVLERLHAELEALRAQDYNSHLSDNGYAISGRMDTMGKLIQAKRLEIRAAVRDGRE